MFVWEKTLNYAENEVQEVAEQLNEVFVWFEVVRGLLCHLLLHASKKYIKKLQIHFKKVSSVQ